MVRIDLQAALKECLYSTSDGDQFAHTVTRHISLVPSRRECLYLPLQVSFALVAKFVATSID
jgi:hypothetical protein